MSPTPEQIAASEAFYTARALKHEADWAANLPSTDVDDRDALASLPAARERLAFERGIEAAAVECDREAKRHDMGDPARRDVADECAGRIRALKGQA